MIIILLSLLIAVSCAPIDQLQQGSQRTSIPTFIPRRNIPSFIPRRNRLAVNTKNQWQFQTYDDLKLAVAARFYIKKIC